jgi:hypothetical protein
MYDVRLRLPALEILSLAYCSMVRNLRFAVLS